MQERNKSSNEYLNDANLTLIVLWYQNVRVYMQDQNQWYNWNSQCSTKITIVGRKIVKTCNIEHMDLTKKLHAQFISF